MKRILYIAILALVALTGCKKEDTLADRLIGEWRGNSLTVEAGIYISFSGDGTFELYQKLETEGFELRRGTWSVSGDILSGVYNDGEAWAATYKAALEEDTLTLTSQNESAEINTYTKSEIPAYIKESSAVVVKSTCAF